MIFSNEELSMGNGLYIKMIVIRVVRIYISWIRKIQMGLSLPLATPGGAISATDPYVKQKWNVDCRLCGIN